jgi:hypothetical protein
MLIKGYTPGVRARAGIDGKHATAAQMAKLVILDLVKLLEDKERTATPAAL